MTTANVTFQSRYFRASDGKELLAFVCGLCGQNAGDVHIRSNGTIQRALCERCANEGC